jgi:hypothetical protein
MGRYLTITVGDDNSELWVLHSLSRCDNRIGFPSD